MNPLRVIKNDAADIWYIQEYRDVGILWWRKKKWVYWTEYVQPLIGGGGDYYTDEPMEFCSEEDAQAEIDYWIEREKVGEWLNNNK